MKYLMLIGLLVICGCDDVSTARHAIGGLSDVKEITLTDGTKCAVYQGTYGGGITCNWK